MAEINYNNLYNQLKPMEQRYYDQQFSKNYVPGQENIMLSSQPAYEQMKSVYEAQQQVPETGFFDSIFGSASAAEPPAIPNLSYRNITPTFDLATGITNTTSAAPFINTGKVNQNLQNQDLVQQIIAENQMKTNMFSRPGMMDVAGGITAVAPLQNLGIDTSYGVANEPDEEQVEYLGDKPKGGIADLLRTALRFTVPGLSFLENIAGAGQPYQQFTPGGTIRNGIYNIDGVNVPVSSFGGDFYNPNTGLNRFDRAAQRFTKTGSMLDLFGSSRTGKEFFEKRREIQAQKQKALEDAAKAKRQFKQDTGGGGGFGGSRRGDSDISDSQRGGFATDDTAGFF